jgi:hypothetical protein
MSPRVGGYGRHQKARVWGAAYQARVALCFVLLAALPACERVSEIDPRPAIANIFGAHLEGRLPPPGLDQPWPKLSSVPPRPTPPDPATRARISADLAADRAQSLAPIQPDGRGPLPPADSGPPPRARVAAMPPVRWEPEVVRPAPAATPVPQRPAAPAAPPQPSAPVAAPEPVAPPAPPSADLLAPPPPSSDLLAPPPPGRDLLAPRSN